VTVCRLTGRQLVVMSDSAACSSDAVPSRKSPVSATAAAGDVEKFDELAGAVFQHCRQQLSNDDDEPFYPIAEQQQKRKLEQHMSNKYQHYNPSTSTVAIWVQL